MRVSLTNQRSRIVTSTDAATSSDDVILADATGTPAPKQIQCTVLTGSGSFVAGNYYWEVTAVGPLGESIAVIGSVAVATTNCRVRIDWQTVSGATGYRIYRSPITFTDPSTTSLPTHLVAVVGAVATYTDTGSATTSPTPPGWTGDLNARYDNGASFPLTLPDSTVRAKPLVVKATGKTLNVVTLTPQAGQTVGGKPSLKLGPSVKHNSLTLLPDGTDWRVIGQVENHPRTSQAANTGHNTSLVSGTSKCVAVIAVPDLIPDVTRMQISVSAQIVTGIKTQSVRIDVNRCSSDGANIIGCDPEGGIVSDLTYRPTLRNMAFWFMQNFALNTASEFAADWTYNPRPGDMNLGDGSGRYLGLYVTITGDSGSVGACHISATTNADTVYWPYP